MKPRKKKSTTEEKVDWLIKNKNLWFNDLSNTRYKVKLEALKRVVRKMKSEGLLAQSTYLMDCPMTDAFTAAIKVLQLERIKGKVQ